MEKLWSEFQAPEYKEWEAKIISELRGKEYDELIRHTPEGIDVEPAIKRDLKDRVLPGLTRHFSWEIVQEYFVDDEASVNKNAHYALNNGASSLLFYVLPGVNLDTLLKDIEWPHIEIHFVSEGRGIELWEAIRAHARKRKWHLDVLRGSINIDCLENLARTGNFFKSMEEDMSELSQLIDERPAKMYSICVNANLFQNAGAPADWQLGIALSMLHEYYDRLGSRAWERVWMNLAIGGRYFMEIAKLRSMRILWSNLIKIYGLDQYEHKMQVHADSSMRNKAIFSPHNNILRSTTEAMSAAIGTADSIGLHPYDATYRNPKDHSDHMARNIQLLLKHESFFDKVIDPAAGSYFTEYLTEQLCEKAWDRFREIENEGGYVAALKKGFIQEKIEFWANAEDDAFAEGEMPVLGVNLFPNFNEPKKEDMETPMFCPEKLSPKKRMVKPVRAYRMAEKIEKERMEEL